MQYVQLHKRSIRQKHLQPNNNFKNYNLVQVTISTSKQNYLIIIICLILNYIYLHQSTKYKKSSRHTYQVQLTKYLHLSGSFNTLLL